MQLLHTLLRSGLYPLFIYLFLIAIGVGVCCCRGWHYYFVDVKEIRWGVFLSVATILQSIFSVDFRISARRAPAFHLLASSSWIVMRCALRYQKALLNFVLGVRSDKRKLVCGCYKRVDTLDHLVLVYGSNGVGWC